MHTVSVTEYRHQVTELLELVQKTGEVIRITSDGIPIAELKRIERSSPQRRQFGQFAADCRIHGDLVESLITPEEWDPVA